MNFYEPSKFPFIAALEANHEAIRKEAEKLVESRFRPYEFTDVYTGKWTTLDLFYHENRLNVSERPCFALSDCVDPFGAFFVLVGEPTSFGTRVLRERLGQATLDELATYTSIDDVTPDMGDRLIAAVNSMVTDQRFFIDNQSDIPIDSSAVRAREALSGLVKNGRFVREGEHYALANIEGDQARDELRWFHVRLLEEVVFPTFLKKGGVLEYSDITADCPVTRSVLMSIPGRRSAWFSALAPGAHITPHTGNDSTMLRCHLGLIVPDGCALLVGAPLFSQNDFKSWDSIPSLLARTGDRSADLLRAALPAQELALLEKGGSLEKAEDPREAWKRLIAVSDALNTLVATPDFYSSNSKLIRAPGATPVLTEVVSRLTAQGLLDAQGQLSPTAPKSDEAKLELEWLNTIFLIESVYPQFLAKSPRVRQEKISWQEGRCFVFDDTQFHEAYNRSERNRVILNVDFDKAMYQ